MTDTNNRKLIDEWFPCAAVDAAVESPTGSGRSEKAIFTWFASRPIAQARAAVLCTLFGDDPQVRHMIEAAVRSSDTAAMNFLAARLRQLYPTGRPVVVDVFSGRGMIPLEAARVRAGAMGLDLSPVATLAGRLLADYTLREWDREPSLPFNRTGQVVQTLTDLEPRLVRDVRTYLGEVARRTEGAMRPNFPKNSDGSYPWGYLWAITITCDGCQRRFPIIGSLVLRHPYKRTGDEGQAFRILTDRKGWSVEVFDGIPDQLPTFRAASGRKGKSAHCPFCRHAHTLEAVKAKGQQGDFQDALVLAADAEGEAKKVFRRVRQDEADAASRITLPTAVIGTLPAVPNEPIPPGNEDTVRASAYGYRTYGTLMCDRQTLHFVEYVRAIRSCYLEVVAAGASPDYAAALASYASANLVRGLKHATRGAKLRAHGNAGGTEQNRVQIDHIYSDESKVAFSFDFFEAGLGRGPGTFTSLADTGVQPLLKHLRQTSGRPAKVLTGSALALPLRDAVVDAVITDPPYYNMIDYADASDLLYVWLRRAVHDVLPDLFGSDGLQDKSDEIIVKRGNAPGEHRTKEFYETSLARAFREARRVLREDGHLVVVFGHSDPDAWKRLLNALHQAEFVVTGSWPSRTESANTGVASIKVTVTIGCRVAPAGRRTATVSHVDREVIEAVKSRVKVCEQDGLALADQLMAAYGPAMEIYGRYSKVIQLDGADAPLERYLMLALAAVRDAVQLKLDEIPLETFDAVTRFAIFWLRTHGRTNVPKGEARFLAQADNLRIEDVRSGLLSESAAGYKLVFTPPAEIDNRAPVFDVVRAIAAAWPASGSDGVADVLSRAERTADDQHVWAVVGELVRQLPQSDPVARALTAIQRNTSTIQKLTRGIVATRAADEIQVKLDLADA